MTFSVGLLGHGTVGAAFRELLEERAGAIEAAVGTRPEISGVLTRSRGDVDDVIARSDLVVEVMGGVEPAREYILRAMRAGKHCESGDVLIRDVALDDPRPGDVLVVPATGAYGHAMANNYNAIPRPPVIFCAGGDARVVVRRETYEDLTLRDV